MAEIQAILLRENVRLTSKANGDQLTVLDRKRTGFEDLSFELNTNGAMVSRGGVLCTLVPWGMIRQVVYVEAPPAAAKGK